MSGFRVGFAVGNKDMIQALKISNAYKCWNVWCVTRCSDDALNHYDEF